MMFRMYPYAEDEAMSAYLEKLQEQEREVQKQARQEYAGKNPNVFSNFVEAAEILGTSVENVVLVYAYKHFGAIVNHFMHKQHSKRDDIQGRILDLRLYLAILGAMEESKSSGSVVEGVRGKPKNTLGE